MDELEISGKIYISSKRAAKENKYHSDYIGQLVRSGKILGTKVGRAWYVETTSLAEYLDKDPDTITQKTHSPEPQMVQQEAKKEVSAPAKLEEVPMPAAFVRKAGLTYVTDFEDVSKEKTSPHSSVFEAKQPDRASSVTKDSLDIKPQKARSRLRLPRMSLLPIVERFIFWFFIIVALAAPFWASYTSSYHVNLVDGVETSYISLHN